MDRIEYVSNCELCEEHKTELGVLKSLLKSTIENFPELNNPQQFELLKLRYTEYKLDYRTKLIQSFKQTNIKDIKK